MSQMKTVVLVMVGTLAARAGAAQGPEMVQVQAAMERAAAAMEATRPALAELQGLADLQGLAAQQDRVELASLADLQSLQSLRSLQSLQGLAGPSDPVGLGALPGVAGLGASDPAFASRHQHPSSAPPAAAWPQDQGDSLYRVGREALNAGRYQRAAEAFERLADRYPRSAYAGDALYWAAFARYRLGGTSNLKAALRRLSQQTDRYPRSSTRRDGEVLAARVNGELARLGNADAAESVYVAAAPPAAPTAPTAPTAPAAAPAAPAAPAPQGACGGEDNDVRLAALNALLQMDSERALPILKQVLARRDACSVELRRKAVFLVSQKSGDEVTDILLGTARNDPDREVRTQAVFWLSQVHSDRAVAALDSVLMGSKDQEVQEKAIFALSQHESPRAAEILRRFVDRPDVSEDLKEKAIFWIGQQDTPENLKYLEDVYPRLSNDDLKEKLIFSISQMKDDESGRWLMALALNANEKLELRKKALFWAGQQHEIPIGDLTKLYDTMNDRDMKEQLIFVYSQRNESQAVDELMAIAQNEKDPELRRKAIFWLGQSKDPRVPDFLARLISK
jgi:HEAT repeat protein